MRPHLASIAILVSLPACQFHCSGGKLTREDVEKQIGEKLSAEAGAPVGVACPEIKLGDDNECTATAPGGKKFPVVVSGSNVKELKWRAENITFGPRLAPIVVKRLRDQFDFTLPRPACPPVVAVGDQAACVARVQGVEVRVEFEVRPDDAYFTDLKGIISSDKLEPWLASQAPEALRPATADCGPRLRVSAPDTSFVCTVTGQGGAVAEVQIGITSTTGDVKVLGFTQKRQ
jgi:hypothetical protein